MTTRSDEPDDEYWRRPDGPPDEASGPLRSPAAGAATPPAPGAIGRPGLAAGLPPSPARSAYPGPPPSAAPPPGWRPPVHMQPAPPRPLPAQDLPRLDADEGSARTLTYGVGMIASAVLLVVVCLLCARIIF